MKASDDRSARRRLRGAVSTELRAVLRRVGLKVVRSGEVSSTAATTTQLVAPVDERHERIYAACAPFTMTSRQRVHALIGAVDYIVDNKVPGAFVECGVWKGGSAMAAAMTFLDRGESDRPLYLFDTFTGMTAPTEEDTRFDGVDANSLLQANPEQYVCDASLDDVRANLAPIGYPTENVHLIPGPVEDTIPGAAPDQIALLRLDTDWYGSTRHELEHLYGRIAPGGVIVVDDYGYWRGARQACDEFFATQSWRPLLVAIDDTGVIGVLPHGVGGARTGTGRA